jgi:leader peptidase (prepilin peptidase)/N-methyltransferase
MIAIIFFLEILKILFVSDLKYMILPDSLILSGVIIALINNISLEKIIVGVSFLVLFGAVWFFSKGVWIGLGDAKLMLLIGLVFGLVGSVAILYSAVIVGTVVGLLVLLFQRGNLKTKLPLGSFISLTATVYIFYSNFLGYDIINHIRSINLIINIFK